MFPQGVWSTVEAKNFSDNWSWDVTDLIWDATIKTTDEQPLSVIKFRSDFDFAPVLAHFADRGFVESQYDGVSMYSRSVDGDVSKYTDAVVLNTAVMSDRNILVLSSDASKVRAALDASKMQASEFTVAKETGTFPQRLGAPMAALIQMGAGACPFPGPTLSLNSQAASDVLAQKASQMHTYSALALAYDLGGPNPAGTIVFHYQDATLAQKDLQARSDEIKNGHPAFSGQRRTNQ